MPQLTQFGSSGASRNPVTTIVVAEVDDPERRLERRHGDRRCRARLPVAGEHGAEVEVDELVAVQREDLSFLLPKRGREAKPSAAAERLGLGGRDDLGAQPSELGGEEILRPGRAADDHAVDPSGSEQRHLVGGERPARDPHERLRAPFGRRAEALGLAAREDDRLHRYWWSFVSGSSVSGRASRSWAARPIDS